MLLNAARYTLSRSIYCPSAIRYTHSGERGRERKRGTIGGEEKRRQEKKREDKTIYIHTFIRSAQRKFL